MPPVATPVADTMPTRPAELVPHVPPLVAFVNVTELPEHITSGPSIDATASFTVTTATREQPAAFV